MSKFYYAAPNATGDYVLWVTDGTVAGTQPLFSGAQNFGAQSPTGFTELDNHMEIFAAADPSGSAGVWVTRGTGASTFELIASRQGTAALNPQQLTAVGGYVVFIGRDSENDEALFSTNGQSGGASILLQIDMPRSRITSFGNFALVAEGDDSSGSELTLTNGVSASQIYTDRSAADFDDNFNMVRLGGYALFEAVDATGGDGLFSVNGASGSFHELRSGKQGLFPLAPSPLTDAGSHAFFSATAANGVQALWITDGTTSGTKAIYSNGGGARLSPVGMTAIGAAVVFEGANPGGALSLYWSNGTAAGTRDLAPGLFKAAAISPNFTPFGSLALFVAPDVSGDFGLWSTNGTVSGTFELKSGAQGSYNLWPSNLVTIGRRAYFLATDSTGRVGVWSTNGTAAGTVELLSGQQGARALAPQELTAYGNKLAFVGVDRNGASAVWVTNGLPSGTAEVLALPNAAPGQPPRLLGISGTDLIVSGYNASGQIAEWSINSAAAATTKLSNFGPQSPSATFTLPTHAANDLNGDGVSDALFVNGAQSLSCWEINGAAVIGGAIGAPGLGERRSGRETRSARVTPASSFPLPRPEALGSGRCSGPKSPPPTFSERRGGRGEWWPPAISTATARATCCFGDDAGNFSDWELSGHAIIGGGNIGNPGAGWTLRRRRRLQRRRQDRPLVRESRRRLRDVADERDRDHRRPANRRSRVQLGAPPASAISTAREPAIYCFTTSRPGPIRSSTSRTTLPPPAGR